MIEAKEDIKRLHSEKELAKIAGQWGISANNAHKGLEKLEQDLTTKALLQMMLSKI